MNEYISIIGLIGAFSLLVNFVVRFIYFGKKGSFYNEINKIRKFEYWVMTNNKSTCSEFEKILINILNFLLVISYVGIIIAVVLGVILVII